MCLYSLICDFYHSACRAPEQPNFWLGSSNGAKEWVFCGSALSSEDKVSSDGVMSIFFSKLLNWKIFLLVVDWDGYYSWDGDEPEDFSFLGTICFVVGLRVHNFCWIGNRLNNVELWFIFRGKLLICMVFLGLGCL